VDPNSNNADGEDGEIQNKNGEEELKNKVEELKNKVEEHIAMEVMVQPHGLRCPARPMWFLYLHKVIG